jgi:hypothetical protein
MPIALAINIALFAIGSGLIFWLRIASDRTGMKQPQLARLETGKQLPRLDTLAMLTAEAGYELQIEFVLNVPLQRRQMDFTLLPKIFDRPLQGGCYALFCSSIALKRFCNSSGDTSSFRVATSQICPNGSVKVPRRSPSN